MKEENLIHIKLDYGEVLQSKKDILYTEMDLLRILKIIKKYRASRIKELELKLEIHSTLKEIKRGINYIETIFPKIKVPKILSPKEEIKQIKNPLKKIEKKKEYGEEIEFQLKEIQDRLKNLS